MNTLKIGGKHKKKTTQVNEKTELEIRAEKRKKRYLFCEKIEKIAGKFVLFLFVLFVVMALISMPLEHFGIIDTESKLAKDVCYMMVWLLGVSALTFIVFAVMRSEFDDSSNHDVYPNLM